MPLWKGHISFGLVSVPVPVPVSLVPPNRSTTSNNNYQQVGVIVLRPPSESRPW